MTCWSEAEPRYLLVSIISLKKTIRIYWIRLAFFDLMKI
jgi:hypothetical protein